MPKSIISKVRRKFSSHESLKNVIAAQSSLRSGTKHWASSQGEVSKAFDKWAAQEQNQMIQGVFSSMSTLSASWMEAIVKHNDEMKACKQAFEDILNHEKAVDVAQKALSTAQKKSKKHDKAVGALEKKGKATAAAQTQQRQATGIQEMCTTELQDTMAATAATKARLIKQSLIDCAASYGELMKKGTLVFQAQQQLATLIPDSVVVPEQKHQFVKSSKDIVESAMGGADLHSKAPIPRPLSIVSNGRPGSKSGRPTSISGPSPSWAGNRKNSIGQYSESESPVQYDRSTPNPALDTTFEDHVYAVPSTEVSMTNCNEVSFNVDAVGLDVSSHSMGSVGVTSTWVPGSTTLGTSVYDPDEQLQERPALEFHEYMNTGGTQGRYSQLMTQQNGPKHEYMNSGPQQLIDEASDVLYNTRQSDGSVYGGSIQSQESGVYGGSIQSQESGQYATTQRHTLSETETSSDDAGVKTSFPTTSSCAGSRTHSMEFSSELVYDNPDDSQLRRLSDVELLGFAGQELPEPPVDVATDDTPRSTYVNLNPDGNHVQELDLDVTIPDEEIGTIEHEGSNAPVPAKRDLSSVKRRTSEYGFGIDSPLNGFGESPMTVSFNANREQRYAGFRGINQPIHHAASNMPSSDPALRKSAAAFAPHQLAVHH